MNKESIVITGSTRGIGLGLAREFLRRGCQVAINGRSPENLAHALESLQDEFGPEQVLGGQGDVCEPETHQVLWDRTVESFGQVDIWINNAGIGHPMLSIWEMPFEKIQQVVDINIKGLIFGSQVAVQGMLQQGYGHLYNMEGFGSSGRVRPGIGIYGTTKAAVQYFTKALAAEVSESPVKVSSLRPGMVITELITDQYENNPQGLAEARSILNLIGDKVETVSPWLVDKILQNDKSGTVINWLTPGKLMFRFATARFKKRDLFS